MQFQYNDFNSDYFYRKPEAMFLNEHLLEWMSFSHAENSQKPPVIIFGGALQDYNSFKLFVRRLLKNHPLVILNLPGQGGNPRLSTGLGFEDFTRLVYAFHQYHNITESIPLGFSYGSALAYHFASAYPRIANKLILASVTSHIRGYLRDILTLFLNYYESGEPEIAAQMFCQHLINFPQKERVGLPDGFIDNFFHTARNLRNQDLLKLCENTRRIISIEDLPRPPVCDTLIFAPEFDNFITPHENYIVARTLKHYQFVLLADCDHLASVKVPRTMAGIIDAFLADEKLEGRSGIRGYENEQNPGACEHVLTEKRLSRRALWNKPSILRDEDGIQLRGILKDINLEGCFLEVTPPRDYILRRGVAYELEIFGFDYPVEVVVGEGAGGIRCIYAKNDFEKFDALMTYIRSKTQL